MQEDETEIEDPVVEPETTQGLFDSNSDTEEEFEPVRLTKKQWMFVSSSILASFLVFLILLFPMKDVVRFVIYNNMSGIQFGDLEFNTFGKDKIENFVIRSRDLEISSKQIESGLGWFALMGKTAKGPLVIKEVAVDNPVLSLQAKQINLNLDIGPLQANSNKKLSGFVKGKIKDVKIDRAGPLPVEPGILEISEAKIDMIFSNGSIEFREFNVNSNVFVIKITNGVIGSSGSLATSPIKGKLCLRPTSQLINNDKFMNIRSMYELIGGSNLEQFCTDLKGTLGKPDIKMQFPVETAESAQNDGFKGEKMKKKSANDPTLIKPNIPDEIKKMENNQ